MKFIFKTNNYSNLRASFIHEEKRKIPYFLELG